MKFEKNENHTLLKPTENDAQDFFLVFKEKYSNFNDENLILDFSDFKGVKTENILLFLQFAIDHRNNGMSFVIVSNEVEIDSIPQDINVVPTEAEARDLIEMEEIERDLGF